jgi:glutamyl-tRNA synthetase
MPQKIVTRFAPSPTGYMHFGSLRTALFAWLFARQNNGIFILRIEDTDKEREVEGSIEHIIKSLSWLGLTWDEGPDIGGPHGPYIQSQRLASYKKYAEELVSKGLAYADPYTEEEIAVFRQKAQDEKRPYLYRDHRPENPPLWDGSKPLRLRVTPKVSKWTDLVRGDLRAGAEALDDFILIKSDGYPTYNFAHIIDDLEMETTHIFRADEFISSTPKFLALYETLGIERPEFVTLPPIMGPDGKKKLSKRDGAKDILDYKDEGFIPDAVFNFLAFIGWNPGDEKEIMTREELIQAFDVTKIQTAGAKLNEEKLLWTNREYIKKESGGVFIEEIKKRLTPEEAENPIVPKLIPIIKDRIATWSDIETMKKEGELSYFFTQPIYEKENLLCPPKLRKENGAGLSEIKTFLLEIIVVLEKIAEDAFTAASTKEALWNYASEKGRGVVLWAMRFSLSGREKSPDPFTLAEILGKTETLARLKHAVQKIS